MTIYLKKLNNEIIIINIIINKILKIHIIFYIIFYIKLIYTYYYIHIIIKMAEFKFGEFYKTSKKIFLIEAPIVGTILVVLFLLILVLSNFITWFKENHNVHMMLSVFISGILFHILCEYSGVNAWYSKDYCDIIPKNIEIDKTK